MAQKITTLLDKGEIPQDFRVENIVEIAKNMNRFEILSDTKKDFREAISVRIQADDPQCLITNNNFNQTLSPTDFTLIDDVDLGEATVYAIGNDAPSTESLLHFGIYAQRDDVNAIIQGHSHQIMGQSDAPCTSQEQETSSISLVEEVMNLTEMSDFVIIKNMGFISLGKSLKQAWINVLKQLNLPEEALKEFY